MHARFTTAGRSRLFVRIRRAGSSWTMVKRSEKPDISSTCFTFSCGARRHMSPAPARTSAYPGPARRGLGRVVAAAWHQVPVRSGYPHIPFPIVFWKICTICSGCELNQTDVAYRCVGMTGLFEGNALLREPLLSGRRVCRQGDGRSRPRGPPKEARHARIGRGRRPRVPARRRERRFDTLHDGQ
jgi:hypothetical protein